jgi:hypothetical protein
MKKGAVISEDGKYRFQLWRIWDETKPLILWVMLNPSKADANTDDPTIKKIQRFSKQWGYGGMYVGNLYPYRATKPEELKKVGFEVAASADNWQHLYDMKAKCEIRVLAHGNSPVEKPNITSNGEETDWYCLGKITKSGNPYHPLYVKEAGTVPVLLSEALSNHNKPKQP